MTKKVTAKIDPKGKTQTKVISFRIADELYQLLEAQASDLKDETGNPLNASGLARRIVISAIDKK